MADADGGSASTNFTVIVRQTAFAPVIVTQPEGFDLYQGADGVLQVTASGTEPFSYQWLHQGTMLTTATNSTLSLTNTQPNQAGYYAVVVSNYRGAVTSAVAQVRVLVQPGISEIRRQEGVVAISFPSLVGLNYAIEYKNSLTDPDWLLLEVRAGSGAVETVEDPGARVPSRFYRILVE